ncbi:PDZ domain-containing protein, partial [Peribacillus sp. SIMBA_075]
GLMEGDKVIAIQGKAVSTWKDVVQIISQAPDKELTFQYERNGQVNTVPVKVGKDENNIGKIMVTNSLTYAPGEVLKYGVS